MRIFLPVVLALLSACHGPDSRDEMTEERAIELARAYLEEELDPRWVAELQLFSARVGEGRGKQEWSVLFVPDPWEYPGGDILIIGDESGVRGMHVGR